MALPCRWTITGPRARRAFRAAVDCKRILEIATVSTVASGWRFIAPDNLYFAIGVYVRHTRRFLPFVTILLRFGWLSLENIL